MHRSLAVFLASSLMLGCGTEAPHAVSLWVVPASPDQLQEEHFFDAPWPSDLRLVDGAPRLLGYHNPRRIPLIAAYLETMNSALDGFSPVAAGFVRFSAPIDPQTLPPNPLFSTFEFSSVQLMDIDPSSPERGQRQRISLLWREQPGIYWLPNTLAFMPTLGFPLRPRTRYALVINDVLKGLDGEPVEASPDLKQVLGIDQPDARTQPTHDALVDAVSEIKASGIDRSKIVHLTVFTTNDPAAELFAIRDHLREHVPPPKAVRKAWAVQNATEDYDEYVGVYGPSPNYQIGIIPFIKEGDGGGFEYDEDGTPKIANYFDLRFSLSVPKKSHCPMPEAGYPIVMYAHGTGGDYRSYVSDRTAIRLARQCVASMGVDQIFHGVRPGAPKEENENSTSLFFFNFQNVIAARTNTRQSALDEVQRARLFTESHLTIPQETSVTGAEIRFDASKLMFFGHSQGGLNGPLYLAADDSSRGGVLSGSSAMMSIALIEKTKPEPSVAALVATVFLGLKNEEANELSEFHPTISLAQTIVDVVDPIHYARHLVVEPRAGFAPKSIYMTEGINPDGVGDSYSPPHGIEVHALAMGLPLQTPYQRWIQEDGWGGPPPVTVPPDGLSGNLGFGAASGLLAQWPVPEDSDGHFVIFHVQEASFQAVGFVRNLANEPVGRVPVP